jgi:hypothetical protein
MVIEDKESFQRKLTDITVTSEEDFFWCPHGVSYHLKKKKVLIIIKK